MPRWMKRLVKRRGAPPAPVGIAALEDRIARLEAANAALEARLDLLSGEATTLAKALLVARGEPGQR